MDGLMEMILIYKAEHSFTIAKQIEISTDFLNFQNLIFQKR